MRGTHSCPISMHDSFPHRESLSLTLLMQEDEKVAMSIGLLEPIPAREQASGSEAAWARVGSLGLLGGIVKD